MAPSCGERGVSLPSIPPCRSLERSQDTHGESLPRAELGELERGGGGGRGWGITDEGPVLGKTETLNFSFRMLLGLLVPAPQQRPDFTWNPSRISQPLPG